MEIAKFIIWLLAFIGGFVLTGKAIYHFYHIITNITGKYANFLVPFIFLMPSQFNKVGNEHRVKFIPVIIGLAICWVIILLLEESLNT